MSGAQCHGLVGPKIPTEGVPALQPLDGVAQLIAGASLVVGVDTGLMHLAAALQVPLVAVFVGTAPALYGPQGRGPIEVVGRAGAVPTEGEVLAAAERVLAS